MNTNEDKWYILVSDDSGHYYVIPENKSEDWNKFLQIPEDDPLSWDVPEYAKRKEGFFRFKIYEL